MRYSRFLVCGGDVEKFDYVERRMCPCRWASIEALFVTMKLHERKALKG